MWGTRQEAPWGPGRDASHPQAGSRGSGRGCTESRGQEGRVHAVRPRDSREKLRWSSGEWRQYSRAPRFLASEQRVALHVSAREPLHPVMCTQSMNVNTGWGWRPSRSTSFISFTDEGIGQMRLRFTQLVYPGAGSISQFPIAFHFVVVCT